MSGHHLQSHVAECRLSGAVETRGSTGAEVPAELEKIRPPQGWSSPETRDRPADPAVAQLYGEMHRDLPAMKRSIQRFRPAGPPRPECGRETKSSTRPEASPVTTAGGASPGLAGIGAASTNHPTATTDMPLGATPWSVQQESIRH